MSTITPEDRAALRTADLIHYARHVLEPFPKGWTYRPYCGAPAERWPLLTLNPELVSCRGCRPYVPTMDEALEVPS